MVDDDMGSSTRGHEPRRTSIVHVANGIDPHPGGIDDTARQNFMLPTGFPIVDRDSCHAVCRVEHPDDTTTVEDDRPGVDRRAGERHRESSVVKLTVDVADASGKARRFEPLSRRQEFLRPHQPRGAEGIASRENLIRAKACPVKPFVPHASPPAVHRKHEGQRRGQVRGILEDEPALTQRLADEPNIPLGEVPDSPMDKLCRPTRRALREILRFEECHRKPSGRGIDRHPESCRASPDDDDVEGGSTRAVVGEFGKRIPAGPHRRRDWHAGMITISCGSPCCVAARASSGDFLVRVCDLRSTLTVAVTLVLGMTGVGSAIAAPAKAIAKPDFTKGDSIPEGATHDWNLGATGMRGWMYSNQMSTEDSRQILVTKVDKDSPADGIVAVGDVLLGVAGKPFGFDPRVEFGKALTTAESEAGGGTLSLLRWRDGTTETVTVKLPVLGTYSATAPYDCPKSKRILEQGCEALAERIASPSYKPNPITRSLNALALLASGNEKYLPLIKKEAEWAAGYSADGFQTWYYAYVIMLLSEYVMETGDDSVVPGLRRLALESANGQSMVGSWGHKFAREDGRLVGYGMMNAPGVPLTISLILSKHAGIDDPRVDLAIERSARLLRFYVGKGSVPYGDHAPWIQTHEDNGKNGMAAVMFNLLGDTDAVEFFSRMSVASHGNERDYGHTGNFCCIAWALPGVAQAGPNATGAWMNQYGAWYFDMARRRDGTFVHQGGEPMTRPDAYASWDVTGAYLLAYAMPLKKIALTGEVPNCVPPIDRAAAAALIEDGKGWTRKDKDVFYASLATDELIGRLSSWSPVVRERAAGALARRKDDVTERLVKLLDAPDLSSRYGACQAIKLQGKRAGHAIPALVDTFQSSDDLWLRVLAAEALAAMGDQAKMVVPLMLERLTKSDLKRDPRGMEQRYLSDTLFARGRGLIGKSLDGVDRNLLYDAVRTGLRNEDGRARSAYVTVFDNLSFAELKPLLPAIHQAVIEKSPSGEMFADGIRLAGLNLLAKHHVKEGLDAGVEYAKKQNPWGSEKRLPVILSAIVAYGTHAAAVIPELQALADSLDKGEPGHPRKSSQEKAKLVREAIEQIKASKDTPPLTSLEG